MLQVIKNTKELKEKLKSNLRKKFDLFKNGGLGTDKVIITFSDTCCLFFKFSLEGTCMSVFLDA